MGKAKKKQAVRAEKSKEVLANELIECIYKRPNKVTGFLNDIAPDQRAAVLNTSVDTSKYYRDKHPLPTVVETPLAFLILKSNSDSDEKNLRLFLENDADPKINIKLNHQPFKLIILFVNIYRLALAGHSKQLNKLKILFENSDIAFNELITHHGQNYSYIHYFLRFNIGLPESETPHMMTLFDFMLSKGLEIENRENPICETPLNAAERLQLTKCAALIKHYSKISPTSTANGWTNAVHNAVLADNINSLSELHTTKLKMFSLVNEFGLTPLVVAIFFSKEKSVDWFEKKGLIDDSKKIWESYTARELLRTLSNDNRIPPALQRVRLEIFCFSIKLNYSQLFKHLISKWTPNYLFLVSEDTTSAHSSMVELIIIASSDTDLRLLSYFLSLNFDRNLLIDEEPVLIAVLKAFNISDPNFEKYYSKDYIYAVLNSLLSNSFDVNAYHKGYPERNALNYVFKIYDVEFRCRLIKLFIKHGADPCSLISLRCLENGKDSNLKLPILVAALYLEDLAAAEILFKAGADPDDFGETEYSAAACLLFYVMMDDKKIIELLKIIESKIDPLQIDDSIGHSLLRKAAAQSSLIIFNYLWDLTLQKHTPANVRETLNPNTSLPIVYGSLWNKDPHVFTTLLKNIAALPNASVDLTKILLFILENGKHADKLEDLLADQEICIVEGEIIEPIQMIYQQLTTNFQNVSEDNLSKSRNVFFSGYQNLVAVVEAMRLVAEIPARTITDDIPNSNNASSASNMKAKSSAPVSSFVRQIMFAPPLQKGVSGHSYVKHDLKLDPQVLKQLTEDTKVTSNEENNVVNHHHSRISWLNGLFDTEKDFVEIAEEQSTTDKVRFYCMIASEILENLDEELVSKLKSMRKTLAMPHGNQSIKGLNNNNFPEIKLGDLQVKIEWQLKPLGNFGEKRLYAITLPADEPGQPSLIYFCHVGPALHNNANRRSLRAVTEIPHLTEKMHHKNNRSMKK